MAYYNRLRDQLRNETPLPEDLSWESMQAGIYDKMGQKKKKRRLLIWWLLPILICGGIGMFLYFGEVKNTNLPVEIDKQNKIIASPISKPSTSSPKVNTNSQPSTITLENESKSSPNKTITKSNQTIVNKVSKNSKNTVISATDQLKSFANQPQQAEQTSILETDPINISSYPKDIVTTENKIANQGYSDLMNPYAPKPYFMIEPLTLLFNDDLNTLLSRTISMPEVSPTLPAKKQKSIHFGNMDLMVNAGVSFWSIGKSATLQLISEKHKALISEQELPGFTAAIRHDISINKSFFVTSMIDYQRLYSVFSYEGIKQAPKQVNDVIISIHDNLLSGEKTYTRGTANVTDTISRKLKHRNEMVRSTFSLMPGFQHNVRNWSFKVNAGPTIGLFTTGKGKTLVNDDIVVYDGDLPQYNNHLKIGFTTSALVKYYVSERWFLHSSILYQKYLTNHSDDPTQIIRPSMWNISTGVGYSF